jgi:hypothetical protein
MSFLRKLFGGGPSTQAKGRAEGEQGKSEQVPAEDYAGFVIQPTPYKEGGQYQLCGVISKEENGARREHRFVRADRFPDWRTAVEMTTLKARQIIDQQGARLFADRPASTRADGVDRP